MGCHRPACVAQGRQVTQHRHRQGGGGIERRVRPPVGGQDGQRDVAAPGHLGDLRQTIGPVARAADQPDKDAACADKVRST
jgi:hypothetical protein